MQQGSRWHLNPANSTDKVVFLESLKVFPNMNTNALAHREISNTPVQKPNLGRASI